MDIATPGPGDAATWPAYCGHPHDPRRTDGAEDSDIDALAQEMSQDWTQVNDALGVIDDEAWALIAAALADGDADGLLRACRDAVMPVLREFAQARMEDQS